MLGRGKWHSQPRVEPGYLQPLLRQRQNKIFELVIIEGIDSGIMSRVMDMPSKLAEYMLKGWVRGIGASDRARGTDLLVLLRSLQIILVHLVTSHDCGRRTQDNLPNSSALLATLIS